MVISIRRSSSFEVNEGWYVQAQHSVKRPLPQRLVNKLFLLLGFEVPVQFESASAGSEFAFGDEYDTVNPGAESLGDCQRITSGVFFPAYEIFVPLNQSGMMKHILRKWK
jgi:hypothetical protein